MLFGTETCITSAVAHDPHSRITSTRMIVSNMVVLSAVTHISHLNEHMPFEVDGHFDCDLFSAYVQVAEHMWVRATPDRNHLT